MVRAPTWVGDVVMCTPVLRALRRAYPGAEICVQARRSVHGLLDGLRSVDALIPELGRGLRATLDDARALRRRGFDQAVLLPDSVRSALGSFLARIPVRAGTARDPLRRALLTHALDVPRDAQGKRVPISMIERYLRVTRAIGVPDDGTRLEVAVHERAIIAVRERLRESGVSPAARIAVVTPGAASKLWPPEHFSTACDRLARELDLLPVLAPGPGEEPIAQAIAQAMHGKPLLLVDPPLRLEELVALIRQAVLLLTNDTGPRSIAVALDRPQVVLMGPTDPRHTNHWLDRQRVLREPVECSPCHLKVCPIDHRCMTRITPDRVIRAARELLG
jgi:heptosyltransferase II